MLAYSKETAEMWGFGLSPELLSADGGCNIRKGQNINSVYRIKWYSVYRPNDAGVVRGETGRWIRTRTEGRKEEEEEEESRDEQPVDPSATEPV